MQHLGKLLPRLKDQQDLTKQIFNAWEENMMDSIEDQTANTGFYFMYNGLFVHISEAATETVFENICSFFPGATVL